MPLTLQSLVGFIAIFAFAWLISEKRKAVPWRTVVSAIIVQIVLFVLMFKFPWFKEMSAILNDALGGIQKATTEGSSFVFGYLGGGPFPAKTESGANTFIFATQVLTMAIVISALSSLLFYWRILPMLVSAFSWVLRKTIGVGGAVGVSTAANIFLGMVEAPLFIKPYLARLSRGELFITMTCGMAGIAGTVMAIYGAMLKPIVPDAIGHILIVSFISAPAAIAISCLMIPPEGGPTDGEVTHANPATSAMDAILQGTLDGLALFINVCGLLVVLIALISIANQLLSFLPAWGSKPFTLQAILGWIMAPVVWLTGIPWAEAQTAGALMGTKTVLNEFVAFLDLAKINPAELSERSRVIMTYSLCGFANFSSIGIIIGGMGSMCPERRVEITNMGYQCLVGGTLATLSCGALVGVFY